MRLNKARLKRIIAPGVFFTASTMLDYLFTGINSNCNGTGIEANPIVKFFMDFFGISTGLIIFLFINMIVLLTIAYKYNEFAYIPTKTFLWILGAGHIIAAMTHVSDLPACL
jgi:hypothetical protein